MDSDRTNSPLLEQIVIDTIVPPERAISVFDRRVTMVVQSAADFDSDPDEDAGFVYWQQPFDDEGPDAFFHTFSTVRAALLARRRVMRYLGYYFDTCTQMIPVYSLEDGWHTECQRVIPSWIFVDEVARLAHVEAETRDRHAISIGYELAAITWRYAPVTSRCRCTIFPCYDGFWGISI